MNLVVLFHRLGPYHHARLAAAAKIGSIIAVEITYKDSTYEWDVVSGNSGFERITLFSQDKTAKETNELKKRINRTLDKIKPDVLAIPGWGSGYSLVALNWSIKNCVPTILMSASTYKDAKRIKAIETIKARIVKSFSSALVGGRENSDYLEHLGFPKNTIWQGYDTVDNEYFRKGALAVKNGIKTDKIRRNFFLTSGRFVEKKNHPGLIKAYSLYRTISNDKPWDLILLGDGPLRKNTEKLVNELSLNNCVRLPGFKQYEELPEYYGSASVYVHPSTVEQWGLVVNEAMAAGLPVLVSNRCGCAKDLVKEGVNGYTFDPFDVEGLAQLMKKMADKSCNRFAMGKASKKIIDKWSPETFAINLWEAARFAVQRSSVKPGITDRLLLEILSRTFNNHG